MSDFEAILEDLGEFGPYQVRLFILVSMFETPAAWAMFLPVFVSATPEWRCPELDNVTQGANATLGNQTCQGELPCGGIQYSSEYTSIVTEWDLVCGRKYIPPLITTLQMVGVLLGACITGQLADMYGRRLIFYLVYSLLLICGFVSAFSTCWQMYLVLRFFIGAAFGGTMVINFVLPLEYVGRRWRIFCGCIGFWACGIMTLSLMAYLIRDWRHLSIAASVGGVFLLLSWWYVPESARWLVQRGRVKEAQQILTKVAKFNNKPIPDFEKLRVYAQREEERGKRERRYSYWDLFRTMSMSKNTLIVMYAWFVSSVVYYGTLFSIGSLSGDVYLNAFLSGLVEIPAIIFVVLVNLRLGRRVTLIFLFGVGGVMCFSILFIDLAGKRAELSLLTTSLALLGKCGISGAWAASQVFSAELFPTVVRNIGVGASSVAARVGGIVAPQMILLSKYSEPLPYTLFGLLALLCAVLIIFLPETSLRPLPDTLPSWDWPCHGGGHAAKCPHTNGQILASAQPGDALLHPNSPEGALSTDESDKKIGQSIDQLELCIKADVTKV